MRCKRDAPCCSARYGQWRFGTGRCRRSPLAQLARPAPHLSHQLLRLAQRAHCSVHRQKHRLGAWDCEQGGARAAGDGVRGKLDESTAEHRPHRPVEPHLPLSASFARMHSCSSARMSARRVAPRPSLRHSSWAWPVDRQCFRMLATHACPASARPSIAAAGAGGCEGVGSVS